MINILMKAKDLIDAGRKALTYIVPWEEEEVRPALDKDCKRLELDKKNYAIENGFTIKKVEEKLLEILDKHPIKDRFKEGKIIVDHNHNVTANLYFHDSEKNIWNMESINFENKIVLTFKDDDKLEDNPPLEYSFVL